MFMFPLKSLARKGLSFLRKDNNVRVSMPWCHLEENIVDKVPVIYHIHQYQIMTSIIQQHGIVHERSQLSLSIDIISGLIS